MNASRNPFQYYILSNFSKINKLPENFKAFKRKKM